MTPSTTALAAAYRAPRWAALVVLVLLPLALRLTPIRHGFPATSFVPDAHVVRGALGMAKEKTLVPPSGAYTSYPYLLPYLLLPIYGTQYAVGRATGDWGGAGEFGMRLLEEPARAHLPARILVALFGALTPLVMFRLARSAGLRAGAWVAAWLVATGLLHVHFSVQERPWVPMTFFVVLSAWGAAAHVAGRQRALLGAWIAAGLAFATHQGGLFALGIPGLAWLLGPAPGALAPAAPLRSLAPAALLRPLAPAAPLRPLGSAARLRALLIGLGVFAAVALLLGHPYYLVHGGPESEAVSGGLGGAVQVGGQGFSYGFRWASVARMAKAFAGYDPALLLLGLAGLPLALARRAALPATVFALVWGAVFLTNFNDHVRYLLPFIVLLAPAAGFAAERLWSSRATLSRAALVVLLAVPLVQAARLAQVLPRTDTRALALARLADLPPGARVAIDVYGPDAPLDLASLTRLAGWRDLYAREEHRRLLLEAGRTPVDGAGIDAVRVEDLFEFHDRSHSSRVKAGAAALGDDPNAVFAALGVTHVLLVDRDPGDGVDPFLIDATPAAEGAAKMPLLRIEPEPLWVVSPSARADGVPREARLPTELELPLVSLWQVSRPGPRLALHRLEERR